MNTRRAFFAAAILGWSVIIALAGEELSQVWRDPNATIQQRAAAVNHAFTNGTPVSVVVAALGTNYTRCWSSTAPPPNRWWLSYSFGDKSVDIGTSVNVSQDPLTGYFTGAGYTLPIVTTHH
jgi:hypothetical protein